MKTEAAFEYGFKLQSIEQGDVMQIKIKRW